MADLLALTIRQPWAWCILNAGKDIENRSWPTKVRGTVAIHAAKGMTRDEYEECLACCHTISTMQPMPEGLTMPEPQRLTVGGIVGLVDIVDCVATSDSPWFFGRFGFVLANPRPLPFIACKGALGFWRVPAVAALIAVANGPIREEASHATA
jgi:hypothetical protein